MGNFSKYLENNEVLIAVAKTRQNNLVFYLIIFLLLPGIFFLLYPLLQTGREGLIFWLILLSLWFVFLIRHIIKQKGIYLLTDQRIVHITPANKDHYKLSGQINLNKIIRVVLSGNYGLYLYTKNHKFYVGKLQNRDSFYQSVVSLKQQNLL